MGPSASISTETKHSRRAMGAHRTRSAVLAVRGVHRVHAGVLAGGEVVHAPVVGVVHEVLDRVDAGLVAARVATDGAAVGRALLGGRVAHAVALAVTAALEGVI